MNGWTRIGIVVTAMWIIGGGGYRHMESVDREIEARGLASKAVLSDCMQDKSSTRNCTKEADWEYRRPDHAQPRWGIWVGYAGAALCAWLIALVLIGIVQWIWAGFAISSSTSGPKP